MDIKDRTRTIIESSRSLPRALVAAVGVGVAFGAGLVAGGAGRARAEHAAQEPTDVIARAEQRTRAYEAVVNGTLMTWHQELTAPEPPPPPSPTRSRSRAAVSVPADAPSSPPLLDKALLRAAEPETPVARRAAPEDEARPASVDRDDEAGSEVVRPDPKKLDAALARVLGDRTSSSSPSSPSSTRYALQLASAGTAEGAKRIADGWVQRGHRVHVVAAEVAGKGTMYRVRIGGIASRAAADALKARLGQGIVVAE